MWRGIYTFLKGVLWKVLLKYICEFAPRRVISLSSTCACVQIMCIQHCRKVFLILPSSRYCMMLHLLFLICATNEYRVSSSIETTPNRRHQINFFVNLVSTRLPLCFEITVFVALWLTQASDCVVIWGLLHKTFTWEKLVILAGVFFPLW